MAFRVAINGFGRIGRNVLRVGIDNPDIEYVAVVEDTLDSQYMSGFILLGTFDRRPAARCAAG